MVSNQTLVLKCYLHKLGQYRAKPFQCLLPGNLLFQGLLNAMLVSGRVISPDMIRPAISRGFGWTVGDGEMDQPLPY